VDDDKLRDKFIKEMVESLAQDFNMPDPQTADPMLPTDHKDSKRSRTRNVDKVTNQLKEECEDYFALFRQQGNTFQVDLDPIEFYWRLEKTLQSFPLLSQMASYFLAAQASEAECERIASSAGLILSARRRKMGGPLAEKALFAYMAANELKPRPPRKANKSLRHKLDNALHLLNHGVPLPAAQPAAAGAGAPVVIGDADDDDSDDVIDLGAGADEGDVQNDALDAGLKLQADGSFNFSHLIEMIDEDEADNDLPEDALDAREAVDPEDFVPDKSVRRSGRQAAGLRKVLKRFDL